MPVLLHWAVAAVQALDLRVAVGTEEVDFLQEAGSPAKVASADRVAVQAGPTVPVAAGNQAAGPGLVEAGHDRAVAEGRELGARSTEHLAAGHILAALDSAAEDQPEEAEGMAFQAVEGTVREVEDIGHAEADTAPEEGNPVHRAEDILEVALGSQAEDKAAHKEGLRMVAGANPAVAFRVDTQEGRRTWERMRQGQGLLELEEVPVLPATVVVPEQECLEVRLCSSCCLHPRRHHHLALHPYPQCRNQIHLGQVLHSEPW